MKYHEFSHTKNWPLQCDICGKGYHCASTLAKHKVKCAEKNESMNNLDGDDDIENEWEVSETEVDLLPRQKQGDTNSNSNSNSNFNANSNFNLNFNASSNANSNFNGNFNANFNSNSNSNSNFNKNLTAPPFQTRVRVRVNQPLSTANSNNANGTMPESHGLGMCTCGLCGKAFMGAAELQMHQATFHAVAKSVFVCGYCSKAFEDKTVRDAHVLKDHLTSRSVLDLSYQRRMG